MNAKTLLPTALSLALSTCLLSACGGGGSNGMVRPETASVQTDPPPPPPPPPPPTEACLAPITSDCVVDVPAADPPAELTGGRQSDFALIKRGEGGLVLSSITSSPPMEPFRFGGGTTVEAGWLSPDSNANLVSNVTVQAAGSVLLYGAITGNVDNHGYTYLLNTVTGDVINGGVLEPGSSIYGDVIPARIEGSFSQTASGTLVVTMGPDAPIGPVTGGFLTVTGHADIAGTLKLVQYSDNWGPYPLPAAPLSVHVLHAGGGVSGAFAQWTSPGLFITGALSYLPNDVYFDVATLSAAQVMGSVTAQALTVRSAGHFDAALGNADHWARTPGASLTSTQRQFLSSVGAIQRIRDYGQAIRTFDSLSGSGYADAADTLLQQAALPAPELMIRVGNLHAGSTSGSWSARSAMLASGAGAFSGQRTGFDQWLGDRLLLGSSFGWSNGSLRFDRGGGGGARDQSPQWDVYLRNNGNGNAYLFGDVGYSRHQLDFNRQIDLGIRRRSAGARRSFDVMRAYVETGRDFHVGQTRVTPFGAMSYAMLRGAGFTEQGSTGFELIAQPSMHQRLNAAAGLRLGTDWRRNGGQWTTLNLSAGYRQLLHARDDARAAFTGAPQATFALDGMPSQQNTGWVQMSLATGGAKWNWLLSYDRQDSDEALSFGAAFKF